MASNGDVDGRKATAAERALDRKLQDNWLRLNRADQARRDAPARRAKINHAQVARDMVASARSSVNPFSGRSTGSSDVSGSKKNSGKDGSP